MILFISTFFAVYLLVFQQQNVTGGHYFYAVLTSIMISVAQFSMFKGVMAADYAGVLSMGAGGACGVTLSMFTHKRIVRSKADKDYDKMMKRQTPE